MLLGVGEITATVGTTTGATRLPSPCYCVRLRSPSANTDTIYIALGEITATTGDLRIEPGEVVEIDISNALLLRKAMGLPVTESCFMQVLSYISDGAAQTLYIDGFSL